MTTNENLKKVEDLSRQIHDIYQTEAKRQGDVRHKDNYDDLSENIKEFDRVLARFIIQEISTNRSAELQELDERCEREFKKSYVKDIDKLDEKQFGERARVTNLLNENMVVGYNIAVYDMLSLVQGFIKEIRNK